MAPTPPPAATTAFLAPSSGTAAVLTRHAGLQSVTSRRPPAGARRTGAQAPPTVAASADAPPAGGSAPHPADDGAPPSPAAPDATTPPTRRRLLHLSAAAAAAAVAGSIVPPPPANAASLPSPTLPSPGSLRSSISSAASALPGTGPSDVYYPSFFEGDWELSREPFSVESPTVEAAAAAGRPAPPAVVAARERSARRLGVAIAYPVRFIHHRGHVVADRAYNAIGREAAERAVVVGVSVGDVAAAMAIKGASMGGGAASGGAIAGGPTRRVRAPGSGRDSVSTTWSPDNPNVLTVTAGGSTREEKITKRSYVDEPGGYGTFVSSEYARIARLDEVVDEGGFGVGGGGLGRAVRIEAVRRVVKWAVSEVVLEKRKVPDEEGSLDGLVQVPNGIDALLVEFTYPTETLDAHPLPLLVVKYRVFLSRPDPLRLK